MSGLFGGVARTESLRRLTARTGTWSLAPAPGKPFVSLAGLGVTVFGMAGVGLPPLDQVAAPYAGGAGSFHAGTTVAPREVTLRCDAVTRTPQLRQQLIDLVKPDRVEPPQTPLVLRYEGVRALNLHVVPLAPPVEDAVGAMILRFVAYDPHWFGDDAQYLLMDGQVAVPNANYVLQRDAQGVWQSLATDGIAYRLRYGLDNQLYVGGERAGGTLGYLGVRQTTGWQYLPELSGAVKDWGWSPDGTLYVVGSFSGGVARWTGSVWQIVGAGLSGTVYGLAWFEGALVVTGDFSGYVARWNGTTWQTLGALGNRGEVLVVAANGELVVAGHFTGGVARWTGTAWQLVGGGVGGIGKDVVVGLDGLLYLGGLFTTAGGASAQNIAMWNGALWQALGEGVDGEVHVVALHPQGVVYAGGNFTKAGGRVVPDRGAFWTGSTWFALDVDLPGVTKIEALACAPDGRLALGHRATGTAIAAAVTTVTNLGSADSYPVLQVTGPGRLYQLRNWTTGHAIYFDLVLQAGETLRLDLQPNAKSCTSSTRGNLLGSVLPGSQLAHWRLAPGPNAVSVYVDNSAALVELLWIERYWSIDSAEA